MRVLVSLFCSLCLLPPPPPSPSCSSVVNPLCSPYLSPLSSIFSCDIKVVRLIRQRSLGNSVSMLYLQLREQHSEAWMTRTLQYLAECKKFQVPGAAVKHVADPPAMLPIPSPHWLLTVHAEDVRTRIGEMKARVNSIFASILKMDSTKKVTKKLAGVAGGTAAWVTNVGNEHGQVLMSVLTACKGTGLLPMVTGISKEMQESLRLSPCTWTGTAALELECPGLRQCSATGGSWSSGWMCGT
ncbi:uncharacterized protein LOC103032619 isoform X1 [Astyanax mexicanus]|uniref:uncharacterized protein LOC103032619 isoform X1 n=1 Tax=Astyanax mexicanus TaxID=7994 RepID=UPI0020CAAEAC|nr:uncharacterized protein LOC103032619 isoform X1 [Astyanax mexicanus]